MVVAADVKGLRTRNNGSKFLNSNSALKKPKMKMKAAKVLKFLLNFLQIKPKNKLGRKENCCVTSCAHNITNNVTNGNIPLIPNTKESSSQQNYSGMSWSYYVHDPFVSNLDGCVRTEDLESGGIFCNESYFEDDYCQDFRELNLPVSSHLDGMQSLMSDNYRLFEPQRTPCGEFKQISAVTVSARRKHASLPDIGVKDEPLIVIPAKSLDIDLDNTSELFDYNQFVCSHPPLGLTIAFDNFLDETIINHNKSFSMNHVQFLPIKEINTDQLGKLKLETESNILQRCPENVEATCFVDNSKQLNIITSEMLAFQSASVIKVFSEDQVSDISFACFITKESQDKDVALVESEFCSLNMSNTSPLQNKKLGTTETIKSVSEGIYILKHTSGQRSLESGYSTSDNVPNASFESVTTPDLSQSVGYGISKITQIKILDTKSHDANVEEIARIHHSTITLPKRSFIEPTKINQTNTVPATSSPMHISSLSRQTFTAIPDFISPINQISATSEIRLETLDHDSFRRKIWHKKRDVLADICLCPTLSHLEVNEKQVLEPLSEDYNIMTTAADFIFKRIQFKEELTPYISIEKLIEYLDTYYVAEISKLSNKDVQKIADYRRITKQALDTFTSDRLTQENCLQELLITILGNRSTTVSVCQDYIFENLHYIVSSKEYHKVAPELIIMLLCSGHSCILKQRLGNKIFQLKAMRNFLKTQTNLEIYSQVKRMFSCAFKEMARNLNYTVADKVYSSPYYRNKGTNRSETSKSRIY